MHVQANDNGQIQHYAENTGNVAFVMLGYWTGFSYVERFDSFTAGGSNSWRERNISGYGVGPNQVAEIALVNKSTSNERLAGVRSSGSGEQRRINIHEAESGGVNVASMLVNSDASSIVEVYASSNTNIDFYVLGYWDSPPGTFVETGGVHGQATNASVWEPANLDAFGVPGNAIAQLIISNEIPNFERELGIRAVGSAQDRFILLQEAESGGGDSATFHVNVDASSRIEWYSASGTSDRYFYPIGWWILD